MATTKKLSAFVEEQFPDFFREEGPTFVQFLESYYEWMEESGNLLDISKNILDYRDIDKTLDAYIDYFRGELMVDIPKDVLVNKRLLAKNIVNFYRARGSEKSYDLLFRILYNTSVDVYYPSNNILRVSDGVWRETDLLRVENITDPDQITDMESFSITGSTSGANAIVERVTKFVLDGATIYELELSNLTGTFQDTETITSTNSKTATISSGGSGLTTTGQYVGTRGHLSSDMYLQDSDFYQEYSYVLRAKEFIQRYRDIVKRLLHPSGSALFGQVFATLQADLSINSSSANSILNIGIELENNDISNSLAASTFLNQYYNIDLELSVDLSTTASSNVVYYSKLSGTVTPLTNSTIGFYQSYTLEELGCIELGSLGDQSSFEGTLTLFDSELSNTDIVIVRDPTDTNPDQYFEVDCVSSNTLLDVNISYVGTLSNGEIYKLNT